MAPPPTALQRLFYAATTADHLFELLRLAGCLTPRARTNRSMVTATMTRVRDAFEPPFSIGDEPDHGHRCRDALDAVEEALTNAGYLQVAGWPDAHKNAYMSGVKERLQRIIDDSQAAAEADDDVPWIYAETVRERQRRRAAAEPGPLACPACRKALPDGALFCVWCRADLPFRCSCSL